MIFWCSAKGLSRCVGLGGAVASVVAIAGLQPAYADPVTPPGYTATTFAAGSSSTRIKPDDITTLGGLVYVGFANGVNKETGAAGALGPNSAVVAYDASGTAVATYLIAGKNDGLFADAANNRILATVNEDGNTSVYVIHPGNPTPVHLAFDAGSFNTDPPATGLIGGPGIDKDTRLPDTNLQGGTDSIISYRGALYVTTSNPLNNTQSVLGTLAVNELAGTATVRAALIGNQAASSLNNNDPNASATTLNIADPDSLGIVPAGVPTIGGSLILVGEGDRQLAFTSTPGTANQTVKFLSTGSSLGDIAWPTAAAGTLYITDVDNNAIYKVTSSAWDVNKPLVASPIKDNAAQAGGFVGILDLATGNETPLISGLKSPAGLLFVAGLAPSATPTAAPAAAVPTLPNAGHAPSVSAPGGPHAGGLSWMALAIAATGAGAAVAARRRVLRAARPASGRAPTP